MNAQVEIYKNGFDSDVVKDVKKLNEKIEKETNKEELLKLRLQRLYRGMEINSGYNTRTYKGYFPY